MLLENDHFLLELTKLFQQQRVKNSGSLSLIMKRYDGRTKPKPKLTKEQRLGQKNSAKNLSNTPSAHEYAEYKCLVRAVYGSKKLSTIVSSKDINRFQLAYSNLLKANMDTLKKKVKENKTTSQISTNTSSNVPSSPVTMKATASPSALHQQKKTSIVTAKKK